MFYLIWGLFAITFVWSTVLILHLVMIFIVTICICIINQIRKTEFFFIGFMSISSQFCFITISKSFDLITSTFFASFIIGILALYRRKTKRTPTQVTALAPMVLLVPGSIGFKMMGTFIENQGEGGVVLGFEMIFVACAIVFGGMIAEFIFSKQLEL